MANRFFVVYFKDEKNCFIAQGWYYVLSNVFCKLIACFVAVALDLAVARTGIWMQPLFSHMSQNYLDWKRPPRLSEPNLWPITISSTNYSSSPKFQGSSCRLGGWQARYNVLLISKWFAFVSVVEAPLFFSKVYSKVYTFEFGMMFSFFQSM